MAKYTLMVGKDDSGRFSSFSIVRDDKLSDARKSGWVCYAGSAALIPHRVALKIAKYEKEGHRVARPKPENAK